MPEGEGGEKGAEQLLEEIVVENLPNLWKETDFPRVQEAQEFQTR